MQAVIAIALAVLATAGIAWFFFAPRKAYRVRLEDGMQEAVIEVKGGYSPSVIEAEAGVPLRLVFDRKEDGECSSHVVFSDFGVDKVLPAFRSTTVTLQPAEPGEYGFACGMNMLHGTLRVLPGRHHGTTASPEAQTVPADVQTSAQTNAQAGMQETSREEADETAVQSIDDAHEIRTLIHRLIVAADDKGIALIPTETFEAGLRKILEYAHIDADKQESK